MRFNRFAIVGSIVAGSLVVVGCGEKAPPIVPDTPAQVADQQKAGKDAANADLLSQAQSLYDEAKEMIGKADFKNARADVDQLNLIKPRLPADWQAKVDEVNKLLAAKGK